MRYTGLISLALLISAVVVWSAQRQAVLPPSDGMSAPSTETLHAMVQRPRPLPAPQTARVPLGAAVDPAILKRALSPPSRLLPPEARPHVMANSPPSEVWQDLQRQQHAVAQ